MRQAKAGLLRRRSTLLLFAPAFFAIASVGVVNEHIAKVSRMLLIKAPRVSE